MHSISKINQINSGVAGCLVLFVGFFDYYFFGSFGVRFTHIWQVLLQGLLVQHDLGPVGVLWEQPTVAVVSL